jgi:hypothetical protein
MHPMELTALAEQRRSELLRDAAPRRTRRRAGARPAGHIRLHFGVSAAPAEKAACC